MADNDNDWFFEDPRPGTPAEPLPSGVRPASTALPAAGSAPGELPGGATIAGGFPHPPVAGAPSSWSRSAASPYSPSDDETLFRPSERIPRVDDPAATVTVPAHHTELPPVAVGSHVAPAPDPRFRLILPVLLLALSALGGVLLWRSLHPVADSTLVVSPGTPAPALPSTETTGQATHSAVVLPPVVDSPWSPAPAVTVTVVLPAPGTPSHDTGAPPTVAPPSSSAVSSSTTSTTTSPAGPPVAPPSSRTTTTTPPAPSSTQTPTAQPPLLPPASTPSTPVDVVPTATPSPVPTDSTDPTPTSSAPLPTPTPEQPNSVAPLPTGVPPLPPGDTPAPTGNTAVPTPDVPLPTLPGEPPPLVDPPAVTPGLPVTPAAGELSRRMPQVSPWPSPAPSLPAASAGPGDALPLPPVGAQPLISRPVR